MSAFPSLAIDVGSAMSIDTGFSTRESSSGRSGMEHLPRGWLPAVVPVVTKDLPHCLPRRPLSRSHRGGFDAALRALGSPSRPTWTAWLLNELNRPRTPSAEILCAKRTISQASRIRISFCPVMASGSLNQNQERSLFMFQVVFRVPQA
jgi:hypothetical protein